MKKYEYKFFDTKTPQEEQALLDEFGAEGWELAYVLNASPQVRIYFRREIPEKSSPKLEFKGLPSNEPRGYTNTFNDNKGSRSTDEIRKV